MSNNIRIIPATYEHIKLFYDQLPGKTVRAIAAVDDIKCLGVAGVYFDKGEMIVFSKLSEELKLNKRALIHGIRQIKKMFLSRCFAKCDSNIEKAAEFLRHLGFVEIDDEVYLWSR